MTMQRGTTSIRSRTIAKCEFFTDVHLWPLHSKLDPEGWLDNFQPDEQQYALPLLSAFIYFSDTLTAQLFEATVRGLSLLPIFNRRPFLQAQGQWRTFLDTALFTQITGEQPNPTDSGYTFLRMARQQLDIPEDRIMTPVQTAETLLSSGPRPVVFVDDFVGSGRQCLETWTRQMDLSNGLQTSFEKLATVHGMSFHYCPLIATMQGYRRICAECSRLQISCAHILDERYSALSPHSFLWPPELQPSAVDFVDTASRRAGVPPHWWHGYTGLGLALAFAHCVPDATLPIFYWEQNGWNPLIRRT